MEVRHASGDEPSGGRPGCRGSAPPPVRPLPVGAPARLDLDRGAPGGSSLIADQTGASLRADLAWLDHTPIGDFLLPGLFLFLVNGVFDLILIAGLWTQRSRRRDRSTGPHWSCWGTIAAGAVLVAWIVYELIMIADVSWLQPALAALGLATVGLALLPSIRAYDRQRPRQEDGSMSLARSTDPRVDGTSSVPGATGSGCLRSRAPGRHDRRLGRLGSEVFAPRIPGLYGVAYPVRFALKRRGVEGKVGPLEGVDDRVLRQGDGRGARGAPGVGEDQARSRPRTGAACRTV